MTVASTDQIVSDIFMPIVLSPSTHSGSFELQAASRGKGQRRHKMSRRKLLHHVLHENEFGLKFESIAFLQSISLSQGQGAMNSTALSLLKRIETVSAFSHLVPYRETVLLNVAQCVCI